MLTAQSGSQASVQSGARALERVRAPLVVLFIALIGIGVVVWFLRQPHSALEILPAPATPNALSTPSISGVRPTGREVAVRLNLNTATAAELEALNGIGPVTARRILEYRSQHGTFASVEELGQAKLMPGSTFERLRDQFTVDPR